MKIDEILKSMTLDEKVTLLTGAESMATAEISRLGIEGRTMADGPHGVRLSREDNCTQFPNLCSLASTWDIEACEKMGEALAYDCIHNNIDMLLAPGINIKRNILCGRNFEYMSEDPVLAGELAAGYINGLQKNGVSASLKHFAVNSQETNRTRISAEVDERTLREIYLKSFEIAVKKSEPESVMCAYNKLGGVWCSENPFLLTEVLKKDWGYEGFVISDWGAVHDIIKAVKAGLDLEMPHRANTPDILREGIKNGQITEEEIDNAVKRILRFLLKPQNKEIEYNRDNQHKIARELAADGIVLLKNEDALPLSSNKYKKIGVVGEFAVNANISGQGSAEVKVSKDYIDSPLEELKKAMPDIEFKYLEAYKKGEFSPEMLWPMYGEFNQFMSDCDAVILFAGSMVSEDTEFFDRRTASINPNYDWFINCASNSGKKVIVVLQSGGAVILNSWKDRVSSILQMWLAGEGAGGAIADVLCGKVNPSGKLPETFPNCMRKDIEAVTTELIEEYSEKENVGYRYYDRHTEEICYPFGHGLSYTEFKYSDIEVNRAGENIEVSLYVENTGKYDGKEVVQLYISDPVSMVTKPIKELKEFRKVNIKSGHKEQIVFKLTKNDFSYYSTMLRDWVAENGRYDIMIGSSSQDIRLCKAFYADWEEPYTMLRVGEDMIG